MATYPQVYEKAIKESNLQNGGYVQLEWNSTEHTPLNAGEVCPIDSDYILFSRHYPSQTSANGFRYSPKFQHKLTQLGYLPLYFKVKDAEGAEIVLSTFPYNGNASTIAQYLVACLNEHGDLGTWTVGTISVSGIVSISFDGATIKSGAQQIADAFDTEYYFNYADHTFNLGAVAEVSGGAGPGYEPGTLVTASDGGIQYNTFRILGGTKNMAKRTLSGQNVAVTERLMLDPTEYPGSIIGGGNPRIMKDIVFDDVYPKMELYMYNLRERRCYLCDDEGNRIPDTYVKDSDNNIVIDPQTGLPQVATYKQYSKWYFRLAYWDGTQLADYDFDTDLIIADLPLSMVFQPNYADGALDQPLIGREFELTYFSEQTNEHGADDVSDTAFVANAGDYRIIFSVQSGMILPSTSDEMICPYASVQMNLLNNKVTLTNIALDTVYKKAAQAELKKRALEATTAETRDKSSFTYQTYGTAPALGTAAAGGIVTSVRQDLITTEVQYTVGYYQSKKGAIGRLSDKIESAKGSGGKATTGDDDNPYIHGGVSYNSIPLISKLVGIGSLRLGVDGVRNMLGTKGLLALIGILLYDGIKERLSTSFVTCAIGAYDGSPLNPSIVYNNSALVGNLVTLPASDTEEYAELVLYFEALRTILGTYQFRIFGSVSDGSTYNMYDLWLHKVSLPKLNAAAGYNDGAEVYMWTGTGWEMIREYVRSIIENLGNEIRILVYGGEHSTGIIAKLESLTAFSEKFIVDADGKVIGVSGSSLVLTSESGVLSTKFKWTDENNVEHDVTASIGTSVSYDETSGTYKGRLMLDGDNVAISGDCITFSATSSFTATVQGMGAIMKGSTDGSGSFSVGYYANGSLVPVINFIRANNQTKLNLTADNCTISGNAISAAAHSIGLVMKSYTALDGSFGIGYYDNNDTFQSVFSFIRQNDVTKLNLTANKATIDAESIDFSGKTITLSAATNIGLNAEQVTFGGSTVTLGSRDSQFTISGGNILVSGAELRFATSQRGSIDFTSATVKMNASQISFTSGGTTFDLATGIVTLLTNNLTQDGDKKAFGSTLGLVMREDHQGGSFSLGSYVYDSVQQEYVLDGGLEFIRETVDGQQKTKLKLTSDNVIINANVFTANAANMVSAMVGETGVKVYKTNSGSAVRLGVFNNGSETAGISFDYTTSGSGSSARTKLTLNSDNVAISGDCITFSATSSFTATVQGMGAIMKGSTDGSGSFSVGYYANGSLVPVINFIRENNKTKLNLTANNCSISGDAIDLTGKEISISSLVDGSTAVFEGGKLKLDYIDAAKIVAEGLEAGMIEAGTINAGNVTIQNLHVEGDSTFEGTVNGKIIAQDMYHKVAIVSSGGNNKIYKADIVMIGGNFSGLNEDVVITLPDPTQCAGKVVTIYGAQKPSQFSSHVIKLSVEGQNQTEIRTAWGTTCIMINNSNNNLVYTNEMVLRSDGSHWLVYKWTCIEVTNTGTYVKDLLSGLA